MTAILSFLALLAIAAFLHPYITYPLSLRLFDERPVHPDPTAPLPSASMLFAAYNEEKALPAKIENLEAVIKRHPNIEILAYSDMSSDNSLKLLKNTDELIKIIPSTQRTGKATGMRLMAAAAKGEILIFTDANVILDPASVAPLLRYFSDPSVGGVAGTLRYINEDASTTAKVGGLYWRLEEALKRRESRVGSIMGADGSIFATRRSLYPEVPPHLLDDMTVSMSVTFHGLRLIHATDVIAYEKNATASGDEFRRKRRIACRAFNTHRHLWPQIRARYGAADLYKYISHKLLRWFGFPIALIALGLTSATIASIGRVDIGLGLIGVSCAFFVMGAAGFPVLRSIHAILSSLIATFLGIIDAWRGKTYQTWAPAKSRD